MNRVTADRLNRVVVDLAQWKHEYYDDLTPRQLDEINIIINRLYDIIEDKL